MSSLTGLKELELSDVNMTPAGLKSIAEKHVPARFNFDRALIDDDCLKLLVAKGWLYRPHANSLPTSTASSGNRSLPAR